MINDKNCFKKMYQRHKVERITLNDIVKIQELLYLYTPTFYPIRAHIIIIKSQS